MSDLLTYPIFEKTKFSFSGHESFPLRYGWLSKGVQNVMQHEDLFSRDDAVVILGVGKNMVTSILHWTKTIGLIESPNRGIYQATNLGRSLFVENGWDPYLEDPGTLWLIHWLITSHIESNSTWFLTFTVWNSNEFTRLGLEEWLLRIANHSFNTRVTPTSLHRDVDVFLRTYVSGDLKGKQLPEDTFDCPLVDLGLMEEVDRGAYRFVRGTKSSLPDLIFVYAVIDYWESLNQQQTAVSFERLLHGPCSPGAVFKLSENALVERLEKFPRWSGLVYDDTAGMRTIFRKNNDVTPLQALQRYYEG